MKAKTAAAVHKFTDIPNIGPAMAEDFKLLGLKSPTDLKNKDPLTLYKKICKKTGHRHDPCVLDTFMAAVDFMNGAPARPWWDYTAMRSGSSDSNMRRSLKAGKGYGIRTITGRSSIAGTHMAAIRRSGAEEYWYG